MEYTPDKIKLTVNPQLSTVKVMNSTTRTENRTAQKLSFDDSIYSKINSTTGMYCLLLSLLVTATLKKPSALLSLKITVAKEVEGEHVTD